MLTSPGDISRLEAANGMIVRGLQINEHYVIVEDCNINPTVSVEPVFYIQGGPRHRFTNLGYKFIQGSFVIPVRVDKDGILEPVVKLILEHAQNPDSALNVKTNYVLSHLGITGRCGGTDDNQLLNITTAVVNEIMLTVDTSRGVNLKISIIGMIDQREESDLLIPPEGYMLYRKLSFSDCDISRVHSDMRTVSEFSIKITNNIEKLYFLGSYTIPSTSDQINYLGVSQSVVEGSFQEILRKGVETESYIHGGFMINQNLAFDFGNAFSALIKVPVFQISQQSLGFKYIQRTTNWYSSSEPNLRNSNGNVFIFPVY